MSKVIGEEKTKDFLKSKKIDLFREKKSILSDIFSDYFNTDINVDTIKIHHTFDTPYLDFFCNKVFKTPSLSDLDFATTVSPFTAYQNIEMFISGVLGGSSPKTLEISDIHRLEAHGFDKKKSFRKEKSKK